MKILPPQLDGQTIILLLPVTAHRYNWIDPVTFVEKWEQKINTKKTKVVHISKSKNRSTTPGSLHIAGEN